jgi:hypothetical protein
MADFQFTEIANSSPVSSASCELAGTVKWLGFPLVAPGIRPASKLPKRWCNPLTSGGSGVLVCLAPETMMGGNTLRTPSGFERLLLLFGLILFAESGTVFCPHEKDCGRKPSVCAYSQDCNGW